ncbi:MULTISPECIES: hypothetical protein [Asanoa]|uniref:Uncharacterized protein n=2 Tax=Asanoa TaxID=195964 RepID=A0A239PH68_9ACTN|nr:MULTISPECIES: hypothetical protein [Asanoa]GIF74204.1 hypothetical protein Asi02nite_37220 [Asanoa siamensis]SNT65719.1 hypothetical protein SAMN05421812_12562 [Asanoa hainanensis]
MITVPLAPGDTEQPSTSIRGRLLAVHDGRAVARVLSMTTVGWHCHIVARRRPSTGPRQEILASAEILIARTTMAVDPAADPDGFAMVWQARVTTIWQGGHIVALANVLATRLRRAGSVELDGDPTGRAVLLATNTRPVGLRRMLTRLTAARYLEPVHTAEASSSYRLQLPEWAAVSPGAGSQVHRSEPQPAAATLR